MPNIGLVLTSKILFSSENNRHTVSTVLGNPSPFLSDNDRRYPRRQTGRNDNSDVTSPPYGQTQRHLTPGNTQLNERMYIYHTVF